MWCSHAHGWLGYAGYDLLRLACYYILILTEYLFVFILLNVDNGFLIIYHY